jgi:hypothetical protein
LDEAELACECTRGWLAAASAGVAEPDAAEPFCRRLIAFAPGTNLHPALELVFCLMA